MPNQSPVQEVLIQPGMSEAIDARMLPIGKPRLLQNLRIRQAARFEKRPGTLALSTSGFPAAGHGCWVAGLRDGAAACVEFPFGSDPKARPNLLWFESGASTPTWHNMGGVSRIQPISRVEIASTAYDFVTVGVATAYAAGSLFVAWQKDVVDTINIQRLSLDGLPVAPVLTIADADGVRLVYPGGSVVLVVYRDTTGAGTTVAARTLNIATGTLSAAVNLSATLRANSDLVDVAPLRGSTDWLIAYPDTATAVFVARMTQTAETTTGTIATTGNPTHVSIAGTSGEGVVVTYIDGSTTAEAHVFSSSLVSVGNATVHTMTATETIDRWSGVVQESPTLWRVVFGFADTSAAPALTVDVLYHATVNSSAAVTVGPDRVVGFVPASKPWAKTGESGTAQVFILADNLATAGGNSACHYILDLDGADPVGDAHLAAITYEHIADTRLMTCQVVDCGSGRYAVAIPWADPNHTAGIDLLSFYCALPTESVSACHRTTIETSEGLCVSGGVLAEFSQPSRYNYLCENGFAYDPVIAVAVAAGAGLTADREYTYVAVYVFQDSAGNITRSAPSAPETVTPTGGNLQVTIRAATLGVSGRYGTASPVGIELYRSWLGGLFYRANTATFIDATPTAPSVTFTDTASDASLEDDRSLYTDNGVFPNDPPSGARLIARGGGRLFVGTWRRDTVQVSTVIVPTTPYEFTDADQFRIRFPENLTALSYLDGVVVGFSKRRIYLITGDGPDDQGNGAYGEPRELSATVGADSPHVVEVPQGLIYKGAGTFWLLPRGFGPPQQIGDDIQETLAAFPYLRSAVRCSNADDDTTHFTLASSDTPGGTTKVAIWDNRLSSWSLDDIEAEVGAAGVVDGVYTWLLPVWLELGSFPVRKLSTASTQDLAFAGTATWIESRIGFGDWRPFGAVGWGELRRLSVHLEAVASCIVKLDVSIDHGATTETLTKTYSAASGAVYLESGLSNIKGTAFRFDLYDAENSGKTAGAIWHALSFEAHGEPGMRRVDGVLERAA